MSIIPQSDDRLFSYFLTQSLQDIFGVGDKNAKAKREGNLVLMLLGLIVVVGTEPYKILLRKNIGKLSLSFPRALVASAIYLLWGALHLVIATVERKNDPTIEAPFALAGLVYIMFSSVIVNWGLKEFLNARKRYKENPNDTRSHLYRGDSVTFAFLKEYGWDQRKIWVKAEPAICLIGAMLISVAATIYDFRLFISGVPLILTAFSFWFNEWFQVNNVWDVETKKIEKEKQKESKRLSVNDDFNMVRSH